MTDALFPPSPAERLDALALFAREEVKHREHMVWRHPERAEYWQGRVDQAKQALKHVEDLREMIT